MKKGMIPTVQCPKCGQKFRLAMMDEDIIGMLQERLDIKKR